MLCSGDTLTRSYLMASKPRSRRKQKESNYLLKFPSIQQLNFDLKYITPKTPNQEKAFEAFNDGYNIFLHGCAGTGKTFISSYLALKEIEDRKNDFRKLVIIRAAQSSKDIGFLPGDEKRKLAVYEAAYKAICSELYGRDDAYEVLKQKGIIDFQSTSFLRGTTLDDAIILIDEVQNMSQQEWYTVLTRTGDNSRVVICGDTKQDDLTSERFKQQTGITSLIRVFEAMESTQLIHFEVEDIVRSGFVKDLVETSYRLGI